VHADQGVQGHSQGDDAVEDVVRGHDDGQGAQQHEQDRDDGGLQALDAELDVQFAEVQLAGEEHLDPGDHQQQPADERAGSPPLPERRFGRPGPLPPGSDPPVLSHSVLFNPAEAVVQKHPCDPSVSSSVIPVRVKTDAWVLHAVCCRFLMVTVSASWAKSPAEPFAPVFTVEASTPMRIAPKEASPFSPVMPICRSDALAGFPPPPALISTPTLPRGVSETTD